jgi:ABC-type amino acid transport substrate-binding protein
MPFQPEINQELVIDRASYCIAEHPAAPGVPYGQEGRQAIVYQLAAGETRYALKVFKPRYRVPMLASLADRLKEYASLPGLSVCHRTLLTPERHAAVLKAYPDLTYAVLMPWIEGPTWMQVLLEKQELAAEDCLALARCLAQILSRMEQEGLAHCDLSGPNLLLPALLLSPSQEPVLSKAKEEGPGGEGHLPSPSLGRGAGGEGTAALVDVEQMYGPTLRRLPLLPGGSPGYAHKTAPDGLWAPDADRFAGAVLLAEMLGWCDGRVREASWGENYFDPAEMQQDADRYRLLAGALQERWGAGVAALFERAWWSETLADCATFGEWLVTLPEEVPVAKVSRVTAPAKEAQTGQEEADRGTFKMLMDLAQRLEEQGNIAGAVEVYRQAQAMAPAGSGLAEELALIVQDVGTKLEESAASASQLPLEEVAAPVPQASVKETAVETSVTEPPLSLEGTEPEVATPIPQPPMGKQVMEVTISALEPPLGEEAKEPIAPVPRSALEEELALIGQSVQADQKVAAPGLQPPPAPHRRGRMPGWVCALGGLILLGLIAAIAVTVSRIGGRQPVATQPTVAATVVVPLGAEAGPTPTTAVDLLDQVLAAGKLRVSSDANYAPQSFLDENGNWSGFDVEVAREVAKRLGVELELMAIDWDIITGGSWDARWDVSIGSMVATEERGKVLWFTNPYYYTPAGFAVHASNTRYTEVEDLAGAIIGVGAGTTYERWLNKDLTIAIPGYNVVFADWKAGEVRPYSTDAEAIHDLALGDGVRLNAVMGPVPTLQEAIKIGQPLKLLGDPTFYEPLCFALDKARGPSDKMLTKLNEIITAIHEDGTLTRLSMQFYGEDLTFAVRMPTSAREPTEAPIEAPTAESIKVALLAPLSGDVATLGESVRNGAMMAIDEWNARGGILGRQIEAIVEDSQCSAEPAVSAANKVIDQDGAKYIIGEVCSSASIPVSDIATAKSVLQISPTSTNPQVTVDQAGNAKPTVFRACFIDSFQGTVAARFALEQLGAKTAAVFLDQGNEYVRGLAEYFRQALGGGWAGRGLGDLHLRGPGLLSHSDQGQGCQP